MPKAVSCKGLVHVNDGTQRVLQHAGLENDPISERRARRRRLRGILEKNPGLAVWIGPRLYFRDELPVLDTLVAKLGLLQPPVAAEPARADSTSLPSSMAAV